MRPAALVGALAGVALLVLVVVPYAVAPSAEVSVYYGVGVVGPPLLAAFVAVALVALLSGVADRSDPEMTAGVAVTLAVVVALLALEWALAVTTPLGGMEAGETLDVHRWLFAAVAALFFVATGSHARRALTG
jgi:hypothetical protein